MIWRVAIFTLIVTSCTDEIPRVEEPQNLIPREKLVMVLSDLVKLEGHITNLYTQVHRHHKIMTNSGDSLLQVHGFSKDQFDDALAYYGSRQEEMQSIYSEVLDDLNKELGELEAQKKQ